MSERSILITGCSSGIGEACAHGMEARGWRVLASARKREDVDRLNAEGLEALHLDYAEPESIARAAEEAMERTEGRLFALFNNGAYGQPGAVEDLTMEVLRAQFEANFFGWHDLTRRIVPAMRRQGKGRLVFCSSILGLVPLKYRGAYTASKFALEGLASTLRMEVKEAGIAVSLIEPGPIRTRFAANAAEAFKRNIDIEASPHRAAYEERLARLDSGGTSSRFKLGPEAVLAKLVHAVESTDPKPQYFVTAPTYMMDAARRLLPPRLLERLLDRASDQG